VCALVLLGCAAKDEERSSRLAIKRLVAAPEGKLPGELRRVVAMGTYVLPDIEQEMHSAPIQGRLRMVEAMRRINSAESLKLLDFLRRWDSDDTVRRRARLAATAIRATMAEKKP
jgi:hypothetical protein